MKIFKANKAVMINHGLVELTEDQARKRSHAIKETNITSDAFKNVDDDKKREVFEVTGQFQFKAGEVFGYDGELNKTLAPAVDEIDSEEVNEIPADEAITKDLVLEYAPEVAEAFRQEGRNEDPDAIEITKELVLERAPEVAEAFREEGRSEEDDLLDILDQSIPDVVEDLKEVSDEDLDTLEAAEQDGKTRVGVIEAITAERESRED